MCPAVFSSSIHFPLSVLRWLQNSFYYKICRSSLRIWKLEMVYLHWTVCGHTGQRKGKKVEWSTTEGLQNIARLHSCSSGHERWSLEALTPPPPNIIFTSSHARRQNIVCVDFALVPEKWCYRLGTGRQQWSYSKPFSSAEKHVCVPWHEHDGLDHC
jgi:hypothetical protein